MKHDSHFQGLNPQQVAESRERHGANVLAPPPRQPWYKLFLGKFQDPIIKILLVAAAISCLTHEWIEGLGILGAVLLATGLAFFNEYRAGKEFDILNQVNDDVPFKAVREGEFVMVPRRDLVVGDIIFVEQGEELPADGTVLEVVNLQVDQSRLTGEPEPVPKFPVGSDEHTEGGESTYPDERVLRGTPVVEGHGYVELTAVGADTEIGRTALAASEENDTPTPLSLQLERLGKLISVVGTGVALTTFCALVIRGVVTGDISQTAGQWSVLGVVAAAGIVALTRLWLPILVDGMQFFRPSLALPKFLRGWRGIIGSLLAGLLLLSIGAGILQGTGVLDGDIFNEVALPQILTFFMVAVALIVMAVPEGLAMSVTLSLAYSMRRMTKTNNLVRKMHACETIGAATVICTDKTGTLTMNQMRMHAIEFPLLQGAPINAKTPEAALVAASLAVNSSANLSRRPGLAPEVFGNPTEGALLLYLEENNLDYQHIRDSFRITTQWTFSTERKFMATQGVPDGSGQELLFVKGAPEIVMKRCRLLRTEAAAPVEFSDEKRRLMLEELKAYQARGMRTLAVAYLPEPPENEEDDIDQVAVNLIWLGFVAIADPVRPEVPEAVRSCFAAGIQVKMVTGDNPETAREIGRQIGLWAENDDPRAVMTGPEFSALSEAEVTDAALRLKIMARARPHDKLRLVKTLKAASEVVAVTGDGTNDAPALNFADVGIAMGKTGTAIAKEAAAIILLDDSFQSIVNAVLWGRSLYRNIQRFLLFQLTINVVALSIAMVGPFIGIELPLTIIQILWVNLIMDTFAALALATEPPDPDVMKLPPRRKSDFIISPAMAGHILITAAFFLAVLLTFLAVITTNGQGEDIRIQTIFFSTFVLMQVWNLFNAKCFGGFRSVFPRLFNNPAFLLIVGGILVGQIVIVTIGGRVFRTVPLDWATWCFIIAATSVVLWGGELWRLIRHLTKK